MDIQKIIIILFWVLFAVALLYILYSFGLNKEKEITAKYQIEIDKNDKKIDSIHLANNKIKNKLDSLKITNQNLKMNEKIIIQKIYTTDEKITKIKSLPNILPDSANYRFFTEFEADTSSKR